MFRNCKTIEELKSAYRAAAMKNHPDKGGSVEKMQEVNLAYEARLRQLAFSRGPSDLGDRQGEDSENSPEEEFDLGMKWKEQVEKIIHLQGIEIEICGKWIWVGGETYPVKDKLKSAGYLWASKKKKWFWRPDEWQSSNRTPRTMEWIRLHHGSKVLKSGTGRRLRLGTA